MNSLIEEVRSEFFPELRGVKIRAVAGKSQEYLLRTSMEIPTLGLSPRERTYEVIASMAYVSCLPSRASLRAVIAHELNHIVDYSRLELPELLQFLLSYATDSAAVSKYERLTDKRTLNKGLIKKKATDFVKELTDYREWQYKTMPKEIVAKKKTNYLTVPELLQFLRLPVNSMKEEDKHRH